VAAKHAGLGLLPSRGTDLAPATSGSTPSHPGCRDGAQRPSAVAKQPP